MDKIRQTIYGVYAGSEKNSVLVSIKRAFIFMIPIFMIGACSVTIQNFPLEVVRDFIKTALDGKINDFLNIIYNATYGLAAVYLVIGISYYESVARSDQSDTRVFATISSVISYFAFLGESVYKPDVDMLQYTKMTNIFSALLISFVATRLFFFFSNLLNKNKPICYSAFTRSLRSIFPTLFCLLIFALAAELISFVPGIYNFNDLMILLVCRPFESMGSGFLSGLLIMLLESVLWLFGIHGGNVFDTLLTSNTNAFAFSNGQIMSKSFVDTFVLMGGCGTTICLFLALVIFSKDRKKRNLCKLAAAPVLFNVNELLVFGVPIVLNPIYVIPFILTPAVSYTIAYLSIMWGIVPGIVNASVQWTTPVIISGYQATGSIAGSILQIVLLIVGVLIYVPFVKLDNRLSKENESLCIEKLTQICKECEKNNVDYSISDSSLAYRSFEDDIAAKISSDIENGNIYMQYQPQVKDGKIIAAEALLRFKYNEDGGYLYPPLVVAIALKNDLFDSLSRAIVMQVLHDLKKIQKNDPKFKIAANLKLDLLIDDDFREWLIKQVSVANVTPFTFGAEITEDAKLSDSVDYVKAFDEIKQAGIEILMDDFSMGNTSISILQKNYFNYIKIDGKLIRQLYNERSQRIVSSIVDLGKDLRFNVIAEYVETELQKDMLEEMGCYIYQGYLYYKDMPIDDLLIKLEGKK